VNTEDRAMAWIERVVYRGGMMKHLQESRMLPAITIEAADLPEDVLALLDQHLVNLGGTYGDPEAGDPIQLNPLGARP
jgi:hypothetical protein